MLLRSCCLVVAPMLAVPVHAQPPRPRSPHVPLCSDSTSDLYRGRILIDLVYDGANRREMWAAIVIAVEQEGTCVAVRGDPRPAADTSVFGRLRITAVGGGYELATELAGPRATKTMCFSPRAAISTGTAPILWGSLLAGSVRQFVQCLRTARSRAP
jgi:hypothetical protein